MTCAEFADQIEDYVNGSLAALERATVEAHAALCPVCGVLLGSIEESAALVWRALPQVEPPAELRERIMTAILHDARPAVGAPIRLRSRPVAPRTVRIPWRLSASQIAAVLSSLTLVLVVGLGVWLALLQGKLNQQVAENARLRDQLARQRDALYVLMSPTLVERPLNGSDAAPQARGRVYIDPTRKQGMLVASDLPRPGPNRGYQVWLRRKGGSGAISAGLVRLDDRGTGYALLDATTPLDQVEAVGISEEPAGGSPQPTGQRMMLGAL